MSAGERVVDHPGPRIVVFFNLPRRHLWAFFCLAHQPCIPYSTTNLSVFAFVHVSSAGFDSSLFEPVSLPPALKGYGRPLMFARLRWWFCMLYCLFYLTV